MEIGTVLAKARKDARMPQKRLADAMGVSSSYLCDLELNRRPFPVRRIRDLPQPIRSKIALAIIDARLAEVAELRGMLENA